VSAWRSGARKVGGLLRAPEVSCAVAGLSIGIAPAEDEARSASMDMARDLTDLLVALGEAGREHGRGVALRTTSCSSRRPSLWVLW
jgi:hypothetical protein